MSRNLLWVVGLSLMACDAETGPAGHLQAKTPLDATVTATASPDSGTIDAGFDPCPRPELASIREKTFLPTCGVTDCHVNTSSAAAGLDLTLAVEDLRFRLSRSSTQSPSRMKLVEPNLVGSSWLYLKIAFPTPIAGDPMPPTAPLDKCELEAISDWIAAGAMD